MGGGRKGQAMKTRLWILAIAFGAMLAITGCGDDSDSGTGGTGNNSGTGGTGNTGNVSGDGFCEQICGACTNANDADCADVCEFAFDNMSGFDFDACPGDLQNLVNCLEADDCDDPFDSGVCEDELDDWTNCIIRANT